MGMTQANRTVNNFSDYVDFICDVVSKNWAPAKTDITQAISLAKFFGVPDSYPCTVQANLISIDDPEAYGPQFPEWKFGVVVSLPTFVPFKN